MSDVEELRAIVDRYYAGEHLHQGHIDACLQFVRKSLSTQGA